MTAFFEALIVLIVVFAICITVAPDFENFMYTLIGQNN